MLHGRATTDVSCWRWFCTEEPLQITVGCISGWEEMVDLEAEEIAGRLRTLLALTKGPEFGSKHSCQTAGS